MHFDRIGVDRIQIRVHRFDDVTDSLPGLIGMNDPPVIVTLPLDQREEVVVEGEQNPVVLDRERELLLVRCAE